MRYFMDDKKDLFYKTAIDIVTATDRNRDSRLTLVLVVNSILFVCLTRLYVTGSLTIDKLVVFLSVCIVGATSNVLLFIQVRRINKYQDKLHNYVKDNCKITSEGTIDPFNAIVNPERDKLKEVCKWYELPKMK